MFCQTNYLTPSDKASIFIYRAVLCGRQKGRNMSIYTKDKTHRITLRLNDEQFSFVAESAELYGVSPSEFLRMVISVTMAGQKSMIKTIKEAPETTVKDATVKAIKDSINEPEVAEIIGRKEAKGRENDKADKHDIV